MPMVGTSLNQVTLVKIAEMVRRLCLRLKREEREVEGGSGYGSCRTCLAVKKSNL